LNAALPGWRLSHGCSYQLANRIAWAWKLASAGVYVVLLYLGFLHCKEMRGCSPIFRDEVGWRRLVREHSWGMVPDEARGRRLRVGSATVTPLVRAVEIPLAWPS
jgi:hypothetical protein